MESWSLMYVQLSISIYEVCRTSPSLWDSILENDLLEV